MIAVRSLRINRPFVFMALAAALLGFGLFSVPAWSQSADFKGLWVGTATLDGVSQVNKATPDLSFNLGLTGVKEEAVLIPRQNANWEYNKSDSFSDTTWIDGSDAAPNWISAQPAPFYDYKSGTEIAANGQTIGTSQNYASDSGCRNGMKSVAKNAPAAATDDQT